MGKDKEALLGGVMIFVLFVAVTCGIPVAGSAIILGDLPAKVIAWIFIVILLLIAIVLIPDLMLFWIGMIVIGSLVLWLLGGDAGYVCVPVTPGDCD